MKISKNTYGIWGVNEKVKLGFRLLCVARDKSAADLFAEMVENEWAKEDIPKEKESVMKRIIKRTVNKKAAKLLDEYQS